MHGAFTPRVELHGHFAPPIAPTLHTPPLPLLLPSPSRSNALRCNGSSGTSFSRPSHPTVLATCPPALSRLSSTPSRWHLALIASGSPLRAPARCVLTRIPNAHPISPLARACTCALRPRVVCVAAACAAVLADARAATTRVAVHGRSPLTLTPPCCAQYVRVTPAAADGARMHDHRPFAFSTNQGGYVMTRRGRAALPLVAALGFALECQLPAAAPAMIVLTLHLTAFIVGLVLNSVAQVFIWASYACEGSGSLLLWLVEKSGVPALLAYVTSGIAVIGSVAAVTCITFMGSVVAVISLLSVTLLPEPLLPTSRPLPAASSLWPRVRCLCLCLCCLLRAAFPRTHSFSGAARVRPPPARQCARVDRARRGSRGASPRRLPRTTTTRALASPR